MRRAVALLALALAFAGPASTAGSPSLSRRPPRARSAATAAVGFPAATDPVTLTALAFPTSRDGWVLARRGLAGAEVLATTDAGASWTVQWSGPLVPEQVLATDPDHAWVLGKSCAAPTCGAVLIGTRDGGAHWSLLTRLAFHVNQVAFASPSLGVAAAWATSCRDVVTGPPPVCPGWVLETNDGGRSWRPVMKSAEPVVAVAAGPGRMWALDAAPGSHTPRWHPPSLAVFSSGDRGVSWTPRGAVHPDMIAGLDVEAQLLPRPGGRLWLTALDRNTCAMHGCGLAEGWSSADRGRHWRAPNFPDSFERGIGMPCASGQPIIAGAWAAVSFGFQSCAGPLSALYRLHGSRPAVVHLWRSFSPTALAWPAPHVGYALDGESVERSSDSGRTWARVWPMSVPSRRAAPPRFIPQSVSFVSQSRRGGRPHLDPGRGAGRDHDGREIRLLTRPQPDRSSRRISLREFGPIASLKAPPRNAEFPER